MIYFAYSYFASGTSDATGAAKEKITEDLMYENNVSEDSINFESVEAEKVDDRGFWVTGQVTYTDINWMGNEQVARLNFYYELH